MENKFSCLKRVLKKTNFVILEFVIYQKEYFEEFK